MGGWSRRCLAAVRTVALATAVLVGSSCGGQHEGHNVGTGSPNTGSGVSPSPERSAHGGAGHDHGANGGHQDRGGSGHGLTDTEHGYTLQLLGSPVAASGAAELSFRIASPSGAPQSRFQVEQEKLMHVYVVRSDLADFYHVHPDMGADGAWSVPITVDRPGPYHLVAEFVALDDQSKPHHLMLGTDFDVAGSYASEPLPPPTSDTSADGYTVELTGESLADQPSMLTVRITQNGSAVTELEPYLGASAHLTAFHEGDLQAVHMHPMPPGDGAPSGSLMAHAEFPAKGLYRMFIQFQTAGKLHTAPITVLAR